MSGKGFRGVEASADGGNPRAGLTCPRRRPK
jgi:hypothetical protein